MVIGIVCIATGKYDVFVEPFLNSLINFLPNCEKHIYLFSDRFSKSILRDDLFVQRFAVEHKPFPYPTLMRYKWISVLEDFIFTMDGIPTVDYLFYSDVDMRMVNVGEEILHPLVAVRHPGFYQGGGSWEDNHNSLAYVPPEKRLKYYAGGFQGGETKTYIEAVKTMRNNIQTDLDNWITAVWHDESHWNKYLSENTFTELTPAHCYPQGANLPFEQKIIALNKNHNEVRY